MFQRLAVSAVAMFLLAGIASAQENDQPSADLFDRTALEAFIDQTMADALQSDHIAGATVAIVKDGEILLAKGYGYADLDAERPVDPARTVFRVGSLAKLFTGTAVMQLAEQGKLDLDADVNQYLSAFQLPATYPEPITLRHLLTHTAGFDERIIGDDRSRARDEIRPLAEALPDVMPARVRPPGEIASYSNWGISLAGYIVELVSGLSFAEYTERNILAPLGMTHSTFREPLPAPLADDMAVGYHYEDGDFVPQEFEFISEDGPAGSLSSTATDMARFMIAHLQNGRLGNARILSEDAAAEMHRRQFGNHPNLPGMAINFGHSEQDGRHLLGHSGATFVFHANLVLLPLDGVGLVVAFNGPGSADEKVLKAFLDRYFPATEMPTVEPPEDFATRSARYVGTYRHNRLAFTRLEKAMRFIELTIHETGRGTLFLGDLLSDPDNPDEGAELVEIEPNLFWNEDKKFRVAFSENTSGEIANLFVGSSMPSFHRIAWYETIHVLAVVSALSFLVFAAAAGRGAWVLLRRRQRPVDEPGPVRAGRYVVIGLCTAGAVFAAGFPAMVLTNPDPFRYPPGTEAMLVLPVAAAVLTAIAAVLVLIAWIRRYDTPWARLGNTTVVLTSVLFLWLLNMWNILGWKL